MNAIMDSVTQEKCYTMHITMLDAKCWTDIYFLTKTKDRLIMTGKGIYGE